MMKRLVTGIFLTFILTQSSFAVSVIGHRGARASWPESSLTGFKKALEAGVDYLEADMRLTADNQIVIHHDEKISPKVCLHSNGEPVEADFYIAQLTLEDIKSFDCGSLIHPSFPDQQAVPGSQIISLDEFTNFLVQFSSNNTRPFRLLLEIKTNKDNPNPAPQIWIEKLSNQLISKNLLHKTDIDSFNQELKQQVTESLSAMTSDWPNQSVKAYPFQILTDSWVSWLQSSGHKVFPWTVNSPDDWNKMITMGVDGIITDNPIGLINHIRNQP